MTPGRDRRADTLATLESRLEDAREAILDSPFQRWANAITGALVPSVRLHALKDLATTRSRLGGEPLLPVELAWPAGSSGKALDFLAQIDLAEVTTELGATALPRAGRLLFFGEGKQGRVVHVPEGATIRPQATPKGARCHRACGLHLSPEVCLPEPWLAAGFGLWDLPDQWVFDWDQLTRRVQGSDRTEHRLLGTAVPPPTPPEHWKDDYPDAVTFMIRRWLINGSVQIGRTSGDDPLEEPRLLLLQLDSDAEGPGWIWGKGGRSYFRIEAQHLESGAFEHTTRLTDGHTWL